MRTRSLSHPGRTMEYPAHLQPTGPTGHSRYGSFFADDSLLMINRFRAMRNAIENIS